MQKIIDRVRKKVKILARLVAEATGLPDESYSREHTSSLQYRELYRVDVDSEGHIIEKPLNKSVVLTLSQRGLVKYLLNEYEKGNLSESALNIMTDLNNKRKVRYE